VQTIHTENMLREALTAYRTTGDTIALVPTMGALHAGHLALIALAKTHSRRVVVSIFVNPTQFGPHEDFETYPRALSKDEALLRVAGVDVLWAPSVDAMYPDGFATTVSVTRLGDHLCGAVRPGHFDGVATVVAKLCGQVRPDCAVFGEKDWQQLAIIRRLATDLSLNVRILGAPIVREDDGLALSSRNRYLSGNERAIATSLPKSLISAKAQLIAGAPLGPTLAATCVQLLSAGFTSIDYLHVIDSDTLAIRTELSANARIVVAARINTTRLIDNMSIG